jgi:hypothetical protein
VAEFSIDFCELRYLKVVQLFEDCWQDGCETKVGGG